MAYYRFFTCGRLVCLLLAIINDVSSQGEVPPHIEFPNSQVPVIVEIDKRLGYSVTCIAIGNPQPSYQWKRNGKPLNIDDKFIKPFENGTLYFKNFTDNENGIYQCVATNRLGISLSVNVPLWNAKPAAKLKSASKESQPETVSVKEGDPATLKCAPTPDTVPRWNKRWYHTDGSAEIKMDPRIGTDSEGNLRFAYTKPEDSRSYSCGLVPQVLKAYQTIIMYKTIELNVNLSDNAKTGVERPLQTLHHSGKMKGFVGDDITLECFFSGNPVANITWKRGSGAITAPDSGKLTVTDSGRRLRISELEDADEGEYVCEGNNGFDRKQHTIFVNVTSAPTKVPYKGLINAVIPDRKTIILRCVAEASDGENLDTPVWFRNGELLKEDNLPDPARYNFSSDHTELHISQPDKSLDTASFQCNVSNSEGYTFYDGYLKVLESIKITKHPDPVNEIFRNEAIDISVVASGDSCCTISTTWSHNGARLSPTEFDRPPFRKDENGTLWFDTRNVSYDILNARSGRYQCNFSTAYDFQTFEFTILIKEDAPVTESLVAASGGFGMLWLIPVCGVLLVIVILIIIVVIRKRNYPRETYQLEKKEIRHHLNPKEDLINNSFQQI